MKCKLRIVKRKHSVDRNVFGKMVSVEYRYVIAVRRWYLRWSTLNFDLYNFVGAEHINEMLNCNIVFVRNTSLKFATQFRNESDAIRIKIDMIQRPDKYIYR